MPLIELLKNESFQRSILEALEPKAIQASTDCVNLQDEKPVVILSPMIENCEDRSSSFYVSLTINDKILHNFLLDTEASHNLMPKAVMDELGLEITKPYHDLFSFDYIKVMSEINQRLSHHFVSAAHEKHDDGYCGSRCTPQVRYVTFQRLDQEIRWIITK